MGSFFSQPLKTNCRDIGEVRSFLRTCRYVSDLEQFGVKDHWAPPEEFERTRRGDCDDYALWTWRQFVTLGYNARYVVGGAGRYGRGHAWVTLRLNNRCYVVEPQLARYRTFPRLTTLRYRPRVSVEMSGSQIKFFEHAKSPPEPTFRAISPLVFEWLVFKITLLAELFVALFLLPYRMGRRIYRRHRQFTAA